MKFTIRDLLLVTVIAAILAAWWVDHRQMVQEIKKLKEQWLIRDFTWSDLSTMTPAPNPPKTPKK
jgi:hypothetical protein